MKRLLLTLVVLLILLAGGGGAAWWFLFQEEEIDLSTITEPSREVPLFVDFDPLVLPVMRDGRVTQHLTFTIVLEVHRDYERLDIYKHMPRLKDAYLTQLHALYSHRAVQDREDVEPLLNKRLMAVSERVLGPDVVKRILVNILEKHDLILG